MTTSRTDLFGLAEKRLTWLSAKQGALAANIANANTPGFHVKDVIPFQKILSNCTSLMPTRTQPSHLSSALTIESIPVTTSQQVVRSIDGNTTLIDQQLTEVSETASDQALVASIWKKYAAMLNMALGR
jgi:flagellar basal-body rod protein FlgB